MKSKSSIFILIVVILLVVGGLVYFFSGAKQVEGQTQATGLVSSNTGQATGVAVATTGTANTGDQVVALLRNLSTIQLNEAVFQNPGFVLLRDISITLPPVTTQGRRNPFAPVSGTNAELAPGAATPAATTPTNDPMPAASATGTLPTSSF